MILQRVNYNLLGQKQGAPDSWIENQQDQNLEQ